MQFFQGKFTNKSIGVKGWTERGTRKSERGRQNNRILNIEQGMSNYEVKRGITWRDEWRG